MIKKNFNYIILLIIFLLFIFSSGINKFLIALNPHLDNKSISDTYCKTIENDYNALLAKENFTINSNLNLIISKIKYRDIYNFKEEITIYKGYKEGITSGNPVITEDGLVGIVKTTFAHHSIVKLLTNKSSSISVKIGSSFGILKYVDSKLEVTDISNYEDIYIGSQVYTSGIGNLKGDIYVGTIKEINLSKTGIEKIVSINPAVDFDNLSYLYVVGD